MTRRTATNARRNNAPIRPRKQATGVPDFLIALAVAAWTMAAIFIVASFTDASLSGDSPGRTLARMFAVLLMISGVFVGLVALLLLRGDRARADHYLVPAVVGVAIGAIDAVLFLLPASDFIWAPFALLVFALRPVRRVIGDMVQPKARRR